MSTLKCSPVLYCLYLTSIKIRHWYQSLKFVILYIFLVLALQGPLKYTSAQIHSSEINAHKDFLLKIRTWSWQRNLLEGILSIGFQFKKLTFLKCSKMYCNFSIKKTLVYFKKRFFNQAKRRYNFLCIIKHLKTI